MTFEDTEGKKISQDSPEMVYDWREITKNILLVGVCFDMAVVKCKGKLLLRLTQDQGDA